MKTLKVQIELTIEVNSTATAPSVVVDVIETALKDSNAIATAAWRLGDFVDARVSNVTFIESNDID